MTHTALIFDSEAARYCELLSPRFPDVRFLAALSVDEAMAQCADATILLGLAPFIPARLIEHMPHLRWIQALTTGTDNLTHNMPCLRKDVMISSVRGIHGPQMAELAMLFMLALSRDMRGMMAAQTEARWERKKQRLLYQRRAVLVGVGSISESLAQCCKAFGMEVIGISGNPRPVPGFDAMLPRSSLIEAAASADFLIVLLPYTTDTHHLIDAKVIDAMKPDAVLINLARGHIVDETALLAALNENRLRGAGLDVFDAEPLPPESPFWHCDNVILTPHIGGMSDIYADQATPTLIDNFNAYLAGRMDLMKNLVRAEGITQ